MNLDCDTIIKQEFQNAEEEFISNTPVTNLNRPMKNETILNESFPYETVQRESETFLDGGVTVKTENSLQKQEIVTKDNDNFIIYELETPPTLLQQIGEKRSMGTYPTTAKIHITKELKANKSSLVANLNKNIVENITSDLITTRTVTASPPIVLNTQLRKRHKVNLPVNPIDKRKRYNIQGTSSSLFDKSYSTANLTENSNTCQLINNGSKKVINHFIKHKRNIRKPEENCVLRESATIRRKPDKYNEKTLSSTVREISLHPDSCNNFNKTTTETQTQPKSLNTVSPTSSTQLSVIQISSNSPKQSTASPIIPELRVKCLCSLTDDTTTDNAELKTFFKEMYEETRRLNKIQQRRIKMLLLKTICDAEESMEKGKCCGF